MPPDTLVHTAAHCSALQYTATHLHTIMNATKHTCQAHLNLDLLEASPSVMSADAHAKHDSLRFTHSKLETDNFDQRKPVCASVFGGVHNCVQVCSGCCSVLQCVAVCCSVLQCVAVCCSVLQCVQVCLKAFTNVCKCVGGLRCCFVVVQQISR